MSSKSTDFNVETPIDQTFHPLPSDKLTRWETSRTPAYWEYRRKWEEYPKERIVVDYPIHLDIEATSACNLRCIMCPRTELLDAKKFWKIEMFDFDLYTRIIDEGVQHGLCSVKYNYLGEPTLNPILVDMIRYAKDSGLADIMFNTNATRLSESLSRQLISSGLDKLFFSFDSPFRKTYNRIRVGADFDEVLANIKRFKVIRDEMNSSSPLTRVSFVRMKDNENEWEAFQRLFAPIVDVVAFVDYLDHEGQHNPQRALNRERVSKKKFCCPQLWQRMFIHPDGVATVCCIDATRTLAVGNLFEQSVAEIWQGVEYRKLRELHAGGRIDEISICSQCALNRYM